MPPEEPIILPSLPADVLAFSSIRGTRPDHLGVAPQIIAPIDSHSTGGRAKTSERIWWKEAIIYQIYPRSFRDSNGDGVGDLRGIIERLDYVASLGVNCVWLNPVYPSPNADNGYDVSDYRGIMPAFGTMDDFDELLAGLHGRGIKLVMDLVVNHSSDEHRWFAESRKSRGSPYRDYYHWWPAERGTPPARFSFFEPAGGWTYDAPTDAYYLHYFGRKQPDLNWQNPALREEVYAIMRFWLDKGVDGFRLDAFQFVGKDTTYPELPPTTAENVVAHYGLRPEVHDYLREMRARVLDHYDAFAVAEGAGNTLQDAVDLSHPERRELDMVYHFEIADYTNRADWDLPGLKALFAKWDTALAGRGWNSIYLGNHDVPRALSKFADDSAAHRVAAAKCLNTLLMTLRGTPYVYQGEELGLSNAPFTRIGDYRDIQALNQYRAARSDEAKRDYLTHLADYGRDHSRTPLPWDAVQPAVGFTTGTPWIEPNPRDLAFAVAEQDDDDASVLAHFRRLTALRRTHPTFVYGHFALLWPNDARVFAYRRWDEEGAFVVLMNWSRETVELDTDALGIASRIGGEPSEGENSAQPPGPEYRVVCGNYEDEGTWGQLRAWEGVVVRVGISFPG